MKYVGKRLFFKHEVKRSKGGFRSIMKHLMAKVYVKERDVMINVKAWNHMYVNAWNHMLKHESMERDVMINFKAWDHIYVKAWNHMLKHESMEPYVKEPYLRCMGINRRWQVSFK